MRKFLPIGSMYAIYGTSNMDPINIPPMLEYIPAPWILWVPLFSHYSPTIPLMNHLSRFSGDPSPTDIEKMERFLGIVWQQTTEIQTQI